MGKDGKRPKDSEFDMVVATKKNFLGLDAYQSEENESYMSPGQRQHFYRLLQIWYNLLQDETNVVKVSLQSDELCVDDIDRASYEENQRMNLRTSERKLKLQKKIKEAVARFVSEEYGYCKSCGAEIGLERLEARPTADQCINCKTIAELYEKRSLE